jgi:hypothetical protein
VVVNDEHAKRIAVQQKRGAGTIRNDDHAQREAVRKELTRQHDYLVKLLARMCSLGCRADDPMLVAAERRARRRRR